MKTLIVANWKMNPTSLKEAERLLDSISKEIKTIGQEEVVICPPFVYLPQLLTSVRSKKIALGGQDCFYQEKGAFTSAISPLMLKNLGCQYVIIGHSERKKYFQETDEMINKKLKLALKNRLKPILCVGEQARDAFDSQGRPVNEMSLVVGEQLERALNGISSGRIIDVTIVYEPVWAVGTDTPCLSDDAMKASLFVRKTLTNLYNRSIADRISILYGGSVASYNVIDYTEAAGMNGVLVGRASLNASEFVKIVKKVISG